MQQEVEKSTNPISDGQFQTLSMPTIESQLPLKYANGYVLEIFEGNCSICDTRIKPQNLHGSIKVPFPSIAIIEAVGMCHSCKVAIPFFMRVRDDGSTDWRDSKGNWVIGKAESKKSVSWWQSAQNKLLIFCSLTIALLYITQYLNG